LNPVVLDLDGWNQPDRLKYVSRYNTTFIEYPVSNFTVSTPPAYKPVAPFFTFNDSSQSFEIIDTPEVVPSIPVMNFTKKPIERVYPYFENLTALLENDDSFNTTNMYQQPVVDSKTYEESQILKKINVSFINTTFVSLKDRQ
jgi:hypothetical protein